MFGAINRSLKENGRRTKFLAKYYKKFNVFISLKRAPIIGQMVENMKEIG